MADRLVLETIVTCRGPVEYADVGDGPPVLYFHGFGIGNERIVAVEDWLVAAGYRLIVPNRPGYYKTPLSSGRTSAECADLFRDVLDELQIEAAAIIGSSGGGFYATRFAARHPSRTTCLVLECSNVHPWNGPRWVPENSRWTLPLLRRRSLRKWLLWGFRQQLRSTKPIDHLKQSAGQRYPDVEHDSEALEFCRLLLDAMRDCLNEQPGGFENDFAVLLSEPGIEEMTVDCPALLVHDRCDPVAPIEHVHWALQRMPQAEWLDVHTAGHLIWAGPDAERVRKERIRFLQTHMR